MRSDTTVFTIFTIFYILAVDPTNNDNVKGVVDGMTVTMASACNRATPYEASTYIVLVSYGKDKACRQICSNE